MADANGTLFISRYHFRIAPYGGQRRAQLMGDGLHDALFFPRQFLVMPDSFLQFPDQFFPFPFFVCISLDFPVYG